MLPRNISTSRNHSGAQVPASFPEALQYSLISEALSVPSSGSWLSWTIQQTMHYDGKVAALTQLWLRDICERQKSQVSMRLCLKMHLVTGCLGASVG